jgi:beta-xylosidase
MDAGGAIDAEAMKDIDGDIYMVWKIDGNNVGNGGDCGNTIPPLASTPIMLQRMASDGITPVGEAVQILDRTDEDGPLVEAPMLIRSSEGIYFLFYSSGCTRLPTYNVRYATAKNISGPYVRAAEPLLQTGSYGLEAPGSVGITQDATGAWRMAFHARIDASMGKVRAMFTTGLSLQGETVSLIST